MMTENGILNRKQFYAINIYFLPCYFHAAFNFVKKRMCLCAIRRDPLLQKLAQLRNAKTRLKRGIHLDEKQEIYLVCRHLYKRKLQENKLFHCVAK